MSKSLKTRIQNKHDTEANWKLATNFVPLAGELIVYDADANHAEPRVKIGDGQTLVNDLGFVGTETGISYGTADPSVDTTSQFYFKYSTE
jgi:hypothetical protein